MKSDDILYLLFTDSEISFSDYLKALDKNSITDIGDMLKKYDLDTY